MGCGSGYPPAEGRVEHSQRYSSQENYIIFSLEREREARQEKKGRMRREDGVERRKMKRKRRKARKQDAEGKEGKEGHRGSKQKREG